MVGAGQSVGRAYGRATGLLPGQESGRPPEEVGFLQLAKSNKDSGKTGCRGKVGDPELVMCASKVLKMSAHRIIF